jgi:short-subunit dehydrogenase
MCPLGVSESRPVAVVTGASSGIGAEFARQLAARGHDLVVVARRADRLAALADDVARADGARVEPLVADLTVVAGVDAVAARLTDAERPVDLLVNNAGVGSEGRFWELPVDREAAEVALNVVALHRLTHAALRPMVARGAGGVINVSSLAGYQPLPMHATYGATKAFVSSFSNALHEELVGTGVRMMVLAPGFTRTEFQAESFDPGRIPSVAWQDADAVVVTALRDYERGRAVCITGTVNVAAAVASSVLPAGVTRRVVGAVTRRMS